MAERMEDKGRTTMRRLFKSKFIKKMNTLLKVYSHSHNAEATYKELLKLEPLIRGKGEESLFELNRASLLYDMKQYKEAAEIIMQIRPLNPEFDAKCAVVRTKILDSWH